MMASFAEGLVLSEKVGLDPSVLVEVFPDKQVAYFLGWSLVNMLLVSLYLLKYL